MTDKLEAFAERMVNDFDFFVRDVLGATPSNQQEKAIKAVQDAVDGKAKPYISIRSGHGTGKTSFLAWLILWIGLTRKDAKLPTTAPVSAQLINLLIPEVRKWAHKMPPELSQIVDVQTQDVKFKSGNHCFARTARKENTEALAGVHATFVCYIADEASGIDQRVFDVIEGALTGDKFLFIMTSNPTRTSGTFYDSHNKKRSNYQVLHFDSEKSSNVNKQWVKDMETKYGRDSDVFRVRVNGEFPMQNADSMFRVDELEDAMNREAVDSTGAIVWSLDVARFGGDSTILVRRNGLDMNKFDRKRGLNTMETASWVAHEYNKADKKPDGIVIDTIGVGAGVYDRLQQLGLPVIEGNVGNRADDEKTYINKRAEMYFKLRDFLRKGKIFHSEELIEELTSTSYEFTETGKIKIQAKDDLKEELGRSPDLADACALSFFTTVYQSVSAQYEDTDYSSSTVF